MRRRRERIRPGLEIAFDLIDSDVLRWHVWTNLRWDDAPRPRLYGVQHHDLDDWADGDEPHVTIMTRTLDDPREMAEGRRFLRLLRFKSYACFADLAARKPEKGEFVIRMPPRYAEPRYVCDLDEAAMPAGPVDPDSPSFEDEEPGFLVTTDFDEAQRFGHADALRLTARVMQALGHDVPGDHGDYYEPVRADVAEELHARAVRRPHLRGAFEAVLNAVGREP